MIKNDVLYQAMQDGGFIPDGQAIFKYDTDESTFIILPPFLKGIKLNGVILLINEAL